MTSNVLFPLPDFYCRSLALVYDIFLPKIIGDWLLNTVRDMVSGSCGSTPPPGIGSCINQQRTRHPVLQEINQSVWTKKLHPPTAKDPEDCCLIPVIPNLPIGANLNQCGPMTSLASLCISNVNARASRIFYCQ